MKIATIGSGMIVDRFIEAINLVDDVELYAVYSRTLEKAEAFAKKHNASKAYASLEEMYADEHIDIIYVASPNDLHYMQSKQALNAKKHVICEKPFTSTPAELQDLIETAKKNHVMIFEAITNIHLPNFKALKMNLGEIGTVRMLNLMYCQFSSRYDDYAQLKPSNVFSTEHSGGALVDINIYNIHFAIAMFGKPLDAIYYPTLGYNGVDTNGTLILTYENFVATLIGAKDSSTDNYSYIQGDKASLRIKGSTGVLSEITYLPLKGDAYKGNDAQEDISLPQNHHMSYELLDFVRIIETNNQDEYQRLLHHSVDVLDVVYKVRINANIIFKADKKD